jgi:hypothetical protein
MNIIVRIAKGIKYLREKKKFLTQYTMNFKLLSNSNIPIQVVVWEQISTAASVL